MNPNSSAVGIFEPCLVHGIAGTNYTNLRVSVYQEDSSDP